MKSIGILGSTGSIGRDALKVVRHLRRQVSVLAAKTNINLLEEQAKEFEPEVVAVWDQQKAQELQKRLPHIPVLAGEEGLCAAATHSSAPLLFNAISGFEGIQPTLHAIEAGKDIALANKEALVAAGTLVVERAREKGVSLIPVDSELTAIFQCLKGEAQKDVHRIILTASGGPFREHSEKRLAEVRLEEALSHPNYLMSPKGAIDSSTLMNKGLEMIAAHFFYDIPMERIEVVIHPQQLIHSMVEFDDRSIMAQMGKPNMLVPIQVALTHPSREEGMLDPFDFTKAHTLHFAPYDSDRFRCLDLAYHALAAGGSMPCFMNAANDVLVERFLSCEIDWLEIGRKLETLMQKHEVAQPTHYEDLVSIDQTARQLAQGI